MVPSGTGARGGIVLPVVTGPIVALVRPGAAAVAVCGLGVLLLVGWWSRASQIAVFAGGLFGSLPSVVDDDRSASRQNGGICTGRGGVKSWSATIRTTMA